MMPRIAFLAISQAHQFLHFIPAALALARQGVEVDVLSASRAGLEFVRRFDPEGLLGLRLLRTPSLRADGLFSPPPRRIALVMHWRTLDHYDAVVTTETTSEYLKRRTNFSKPLIQIKHGAGDRAAGYKHTHRAFDLILVAGEKDRQRMIDMKLVAPDRVTVTGYAKFECEAAPARPFGDDPRPLALYNPHFERPVSTWHGHCDEVLDAMAAIPEWTFIIAPHVKLARGRSLGEPPSANIRIDPGSIHSTDMSYTRAAQVYIGDASSQVYEFIRTPRPCIFLNLDRIAWEGNPFYDHWRLGQVIDDIGELRGALVRAEELQPRFEPLQRGALARSIDPSPTPASQRQARAILDFVKDS
jgi:hypothetical protein